MFARVSLEDTRYRSFWPGEQPIKTKRRRQIVWDDQIFSKFRFYFDIFIIVDIAAPTFDWSW